MICPCLFEFTENFILLKWNKISSIRLLKCKLKVPNYLSFYLIFWFAEWLNQIDLDEENQTYMIVYIFDVYIQISFVFRCSRKMPGICIVELILIVCHMA